MASEASALYCEVCEHELIKLGVCAESSGAGTWEINSRESWYKRGSSSSQLAITVNTFAVPGSSGSSDELKG